MGLVQLSGPIFPTESYIAPIADSSALGGGYAIHMYVLTTIIGPCWISYYPDYFVEVHNQERLAEHHVYILVNLHDALVICRNHTGKKSCVLGMYFHTLHAVNEGCQSKEECLDLKVTQAFFFAFCFALKALKVYENVIVKEPLLSVRTESQTPNVNGPPGALIVNL
jgi:hypothetical protein